MPAAAVAPDLVEPVVGFRQWRLVDRGLFSLYSAARWPQGEMRASCAIGEHDPLVVPAKTCVCGIYAYYDPCPRTASTGSHFINGVVVLWGAIELHATGMRASHARVVAFELPLGCRRKRRELAAVADRLRVPVARHQNLAVLAAEHGSPLPATLRPSRAHATTDIGDRNRGPDWGRASVLAVRAWLESLRR